MYSLKDLTDQQLSMKVAKLCGWKMGSDGTQWWHDDAGSGVPPDYVNDLSAMRQAESMFNIAQCDFYEHMLQQIVGRAAIEKQGLTADLFMWHASGRHRAEAFVLTITEVKDL